MKEPCKYCRSGEVLKNVSPVRDMPVYEFADCEFCGGTGMTPARMAARTRIHVEAQWALDQIAKIFEECTQNGKLDSERLYQLLRNTDLKSRASAYGLRRAGPTPKSS